MGKQVTLSHIHRELGEISSKLADMHSDLKDLQPRVRKLESFRTYVTGGAAAVSALFITVITVLRLTGISF